MRRTTLTVSAACVMGLLVGGGSAGAGGPTNAFTLYWPGDRVDDLPLSAILQRDDTAQFVSFVYGDCEASGDAGCAAPAEIQVWPACRRNLALYEDASWSGALPELISVRGVPAALFDGGTRLELETGASAVVVFAHSRALLLRIAAALRSLDGSISPGRPLPAPDRAGEEGAAAC